MSDSYWEARSRIVTGSCVVQHIARAFCQSGPDPRVIYLTHDSMLQPLTLRLIRWPQEGCTQAYLLPVACTRHSFPRLVIATSDSRRIGGSCGHPGGGTVVHHTFSIHCRWVKRIGNAPHFGTRPCPIWTLAYPILAPDQNQPRTRSRTPGAFSAIRCSTGGQWAVRSRVPGCISAEGSYSRPRHVKRSVGIDRMPQTGQYGAATIMGGTYGVGTMGLTDAFERDCVEKMSGRDRGVLPRSAQARRGSR